MTRHIPAALDIRGFAARHGLRIRRSEDGDPVIPGKHGEIFSYGRGRYGCLVMNGTVRYWNSVRRSLVAAGFEVTQNGECEGTAVFDPRDCQQARQAIRAVSAKRKRTVSEGLRAALVERLGAVEKQGTPADPRVISEESPEEGPLVSLISTKTPQVGVR